MIARARTHSSASPRPGSQDRLGMRALLTFFSARVLRGGPRILLHLAICLVALLLIIKLMPQGLSDAAFGSLSSGYTYSFWEWSDEDRHRHGAGEEASFKGDVYSEVDGLRLVVFGEDDIATPTHSQGDNSESPSWTQVLCHELNCSSHLSFVPSVKDRTHSLLSNDLYAYALEKVFNETEPLGDKPGYNYSFLEDEYPIYWEAPDLTKQVKAFLAMPPSQMKTNQTVWVFSFGTWDIWSLASIPIKISEPLVDDMVNILFDNIELLYQHSIINASVPATEAAPDAAPETVETPRETNTTSSPRSHGREVFRILLPKLFDPSMTPGWHNHRPTAPAVHSKAEQMRNAARLTNRWNDRLRYAMEIWAKTPDPTPDAGKPAEAAAGGADKASEATTTTTTATTEPNLPTPAAQEESNAASATPTPAAPVPQYPLRDGILFDLANYLLEVIVDRQFRNAELTDSNGIGDKVLVSSYLEVWRPCVAEDDGAEDDTEEDDDEDDEDDDIFFASEIPQAKKARHHVPRIRGRAPEDTDDSALLASGSTPPPPLDETAPVGGQVEGSSELVTAAACAAPQDYLFYTSFTVSQRAIAEIAQKAATMVRLNESVRARWAGTSVST